MDTKGVMQELGDNTIQRVDWQNVCPVVVLPRAYKFALGFRPIALAFVGLAMTSFFAYFFLPEGEPPTEVVHVEKKFAIETEENDLADSVEPFGFVAATTDRVVPNYSEFLATGTPAHWYANVMTFSKRQSRPESTALIPHEISHPWAQFSAVGREVFSPRNSSIPACLCWFVVVLAIWACVGGLITRIVALRFAQDRRETFPQLLDFIRKKWLSYIGAIFLPAVGVFFALIPVWLLGILWQAVDANLSVATTPGYVIHMVGGFVHLILTFPFALIAVLIMIGFVFGWPLMFAAISAEGSDAFDAVSRGFSYVYQRPVQFVFYHLCNLVIYTIGVMIAYFVFHETVKLIGYDPTGLMIIFNSFAFAYFWSSSTVIYFLLRRSCDATPFDQVYSGNLKKRTLQPFSLPGQNAETNPELPLVIDPPIRR